MICRFVRRCEMPQGIWRQLMTIQRKRLKNMKREKKKERAGRWGCDVKLTPNVVGVKEGLIDRRTNLRGGQTGGCAFQPPQADDYQKWKVKLLLRNP
jgi:hypothetical protein